MQRKSNQWREELFYLRTLKMDYLMIRWRFVKRQIYSSKTLMRVGRLVIGIIGVTVVVFLAINGYGYWRTGFSDYVTPSGDFQRGKTLWDWMELLIVPLFLAMGAYYLARSERLSERELSLDRQREDALQTYFDRMTTLIADEGLLQSEEDSEIRNLARSRTLATLRGLDGYRKGIVIRFLFELELIHLQATVIKLNRADLSEVDSPGLHLDRVNLHATSLDKANLSHAQLYGSDLASSTIMEADLSSANLMGAQMEYVQLQKSNLFSADLSLARLGEANLQDTDLSRANLARAQVFRADLSGANLYKARLTETVLSDALLINTNLSYADLTGADLNNANLKGANLIGAVLADADLTGAIVSMKQLKRAASLQGAKLPSTLVKGKLRAG